MGAAADCLHHEHSRCRRVPLPANETSPQSRPAERPPDPPAPGSGSGSGSGSGPAAGGWPLGLKVALAVLVLAFVWSPFLAMLLRLSRVNPSLAPTGEPAGRPLPPGPLAPQMLPPVTAPQNPPLPQTPGSAPPAPAPSP